MKLIKIERTKRGTKNNIKSDMKASNLIDQSLDDLEIQRSVFQNALMKLDEFEKLRDNREKKDVLTMANLRLDYDENNDGFYEVDGNLYFLQKNGNLYQLDFQLPNR